jgi:hypothetical protein
MLKDYTTPDYSDQSQHLIVNNLAKDPFIAEIRDYNIIIDSLDRDFDKYKNPFEYRINFNDIPNSSDAGILRNFDNVKYIKVDRCVLPSKYYYVKQATTLSSTDFDTIKMMNLTDNPLNSEFTLTSTDVSGNYAVIDIVDVLSTDTVTYTRYIKWSDVQPYPTAVDATFEMSFTFNSNSGAMPLDPHSSSPVYPSGYAVTRYLMKAFNIANDKYTLLHVDEFSNAIENTTSDTIKKAFSVLFYDGCQSGTNYVSSRYPDKVFRTSALGRINRLSVSFKNFNGHQLKNSAEDYIDYHIPATKQCDCTTSIDGYFERDYRCSCTYFRNKYFQKFQNLMVLKVGVMETQIEKENF